MTSLVTETTRRAVESAADATIIGALVIGLLLGVLIAREALSAADPRSPMLEILDPVGRPLLAAAAMVVGLRVVAIFTG